MLFQVSARTMQPPGSARKRRTGFHRRWNGALQLTGGALVIAVFMVVTGGLPYFRFIFLPVCLSVTRSIIRTRSRYHLNVFLNGAVVYGLLTVLLALVYYSTIAVFELITHPPDIDRVIIVCTTLAWTVLLEPLRVYIQAFIDRRFNRRDYEAFKAIEAFNATLREEIDLVQLRERLLAVIQKTMQPQVVSLWVRKVVQDETEGQPTHIIQREQGRSVVGEGQALPSAGSDPMEIGVDDADLTVIHFLHHPGAVELARLQLDAPLVRRLKKDEVEIALPLISQGELLGLLLLGPRLDGESYTHENYSLLNTLATQVAPALRVVQMVQVQQAQVREHERIEQELRTAQFIQQSLLPKDVPTLTDWQIVPYYRPAREVGGDFYDFLLLADGHVGIVIGDVTDKGVPAALLMATTLTMLRTAVRGTASPGKVLAQVNELLYAQTPSRMFVTCFYAILDPVSGRLRYANAGQDLPYRWSRAGSSELCARGMPLGMMPGSYYEEDEIILSPGDNLLFYSDGLVEAHNPGREMFGEARLKTLLQAEHTNGSATISSLLHELKSFTGEGWEQEDDVTLVALQNTLQAHIPNEGL